MCLKCSERERCTTLCPEAEAYVNQDHVPQREINFSSIELDIETVADTNMWDYELPDDGLTYRQRRIYGLHKAGLSSRKIADILQVDDSYIRRTIRLCNDLLSTGGD